MSDHLDAYAAGFFDGEGSIDVKYSLTNGGKYERFYLRVCIGQKRPDVLHILQSRYGGSVCIRSNGMAYLVMTTACAGKFLEAVRPHLIVKADEADLAIAFQATFDRAKIEKGQHRMPMLPVEVRAVRYRLMNAIRDYRQAKGLYARDRNSVPAERAVPSAA